MEEGMNRVGPLVTVVCVTYEHALFIGRALDGILAQRTDFTIEVLVHDDASTDGTADIIRDRASLHPQVIIPIIQPVNVYSQGKKPWSICFERARGKYIALCEGDDYWTDPLKLQRQVDAMERDPRASGCFTNAYNEHDGVRKVFLGEYNRVPTGLVLEEAEYLSGQGIPTCTFLFRRELVKNYPSVIERFKTGDTALFTLLLGQGHFIYQPEFTGVRVMHPGGIYSLLGQVHQLRVQLHNIQAQDRLSQGRYSELLRKRRSAGLRGSWNQATRTRNWELAKLAWRHLFWERSTMGWSIGRLMANGLLVYSPRMYGLLVRVKSRVKAFITLCVHRSDEGLE
jgi:glycosyltransferase involved in cell wall biosynthesis